MMSKVDKHAEICKSLNELYAHKNADYGDSFGKSFNEYGLTMACIRLEDKLNRIKALSKQTAQVSDETITDTLMDLANYSIMTLVELDQAEPTEVAEAEDGTECGEPPKRGNHDPHCSIARESCQCLSCANDRSVCKMHLGMNFRCCMEEDRLHRGCPMSDCPHYVEETPDE